MKITFLRHGHSNNSSSSHSLIFTRQELPSSDESSEFGWQHFTCSNKQDKLNYLLTCLYDKFSRSIKFPSLYEIDDYENDDWHSSVKSAREGLSNLEKALFEKWVEIYLGYKDFNVSGYVDHQSAISFPYNRGGEKIHHEFAKSFINEFVSGDWYVFGGNDNEDRCDPPISDEKSDFEDFRAVWKFLTDTGDIMCVKDQLTSEYVLSNMGGVNYNGSIIKIKF
jgi:hypothetical protein